MYQILIAVFEVLHGHADTEHEQDHILQASESLIF